MGHRVFTLVSVLSLLLCAASVLLWATTFRWEMLIEHTSMYPIGPDWRWGNWQLWSRDAGVFYRSDRWDVGNPHFADQRSEKPGQWSDKVQPLGTSGPAMGYPTNLRPFWNGMVMFPNVGWAKVRSRHYLGVYLPYWCLLLLTIPLPAMWLIRFRRARIRLHRSLCLACGYNLKGNTSGVCPECGGAIKAS